MIRLLFLDRHGNCFSPMACSLAQCLAQEDIELHAAAIDVQSLHPHTLTVMAEVNQPLCHQLCQPLDQIDLIDVQLVITLTHDVDVPLSILPGTPAVLHWDITDPFSDDHEPTIAEFRQVRDELTSRLRDFFTGGYLHAIVAIKHNNEQLLDQFTDGIMAHNTDRVITCFNTAAEKITGYQRQEVIGRDCHEVFPGNFCGNKCLFKNKGDKPSFTNICYPLKITTKDAQQRRIEVSMIPMRSAKGNLQGVLSSFHDITEVTQLRHRLKTVQSYHGIIGATDKMQAIYELVSDLAASDSPVLIQGESGTGKELVANAIHGESARAGKPFVTVNCGALPEGILESELFGHVRGAFTGAIRDKKGRFELADTGTLFLDEVAELTPNMQVRLLRVLQEHTFERVGGEKSLRVDIRIISATNKDLRKLVRQNKFREDLFYRLCVVPVIIPSLRERRNDIPALTKHFIARFAGELDRPETDINHDAMHCMLDYSWPGNIRELQNAIQYALIKCKKSVILREHLPAEILAEVPLKPIQPHRRGKLDIDLVTKALGQSGGNKVKAAKKLGVGRATLYRFLKAGV